MQNKMFSGKSMRCLKSVFITMLKNTELAVAHVSSLANLLLHLNIFIISLIVRLCESYSMAWHELKPTCYKVVVKVHSVIFLTKYINWYMCYDVMRLVMQYNCFENAVDVATSM